MNGILETMRSLYRRLSNREMSARPISRRTAIAWGIGTPLALLVGGGAGLQRVLPGGSAFRPPAISAAATSLETALDSIMRIAWVAKGREYRDLLAQQVRATLPPEDLKGLVLDSTSLDTFMEIFSLVRTEAESVVKEQPSLSSIDYLGMCSSPEVKFDSPKDDVPASAPIAFTLDTTLMGWAGDSYPLDKAIELEGEAAFRDSIVHVSSLVQV